jgi:hypothetical protein
VAEAETEPEADFGRSLPQSLSGNAQSHQLQKQKRQLHDNTLFDGKREQSENRAYQSKNYKKVNFHFL